MDWQNSTEAAFGLDELEREPAADALFGSLPAEAAKAKSYAAWSRDLVQWLYGSQTLELFKSPSLGETSQPGESERDFRVRLQQAGREKRDESVEKLRKAYAPKMAALEERIRRAEQAAEREKEQASQQKMQTAISVGATLLGAFLGRKAVSTATMGRAATAARAGSRTWKETQDVARAAETVEALKQQLADLESQFAAETQALESAVSPATETFDTVSVKLKKTNITVRLVALSWMPHWQDSQGKRSAGVLSGWRLVVCGKQNAHYPGHWREAQVPPPSVCRPCRGLPRQAQPARCAMFPVLGLARQAPTRTRITGRVSAAVH